MTAFCIYCDHAEHEHEPGDACRSEGCSCPFFGRRWAVGERVEIVTIPQAWYSGMLGTVVEVDDDWEDTFTVRVRLDPGPQDKWVDNCDHVWLAPFELRRAEV